MRFKICIFYHLIALKFCKKFVQLETLQKWRWKMFQKILLQSPFYRDLALKKKTLDTFPLMNKTSFMSNFNRINTKKIQLEEAFKLALDAEESRNFTPMIGKITVGLSSGTSGNRGVFLASEKERAQWVACVLDRIIGFQLKNRKVAFFLRANSNLYDSAKSSLLDFNFFDLLQPIELHVERLNRLQPHIIVGQPSLLLRLAQATQSGKLNLNPQKIISVAEVLYPEDRRFLESIFKQTIHQVYQCTEGLLASTCSAGVLHFHEDYLIIEKKYLDNTKSKFHPVITDLMRSSQPIVRYELNDIITEKASCTCGSKTTAIETIEGRSDDVFSFQNRHAQQIDIYPDFFRRAIIFADEHVRDYVLIMKSTTQLELFIDGDLESFKRCKHAIQELLFKFEVENCTILALEDYQIAADQKFRRIKNESKS